MCQLSELTLNPKLVGTPSSTTMSSNRSAMDRQVQREEKTVDTGLIGKIAKRPFRNNSISPFDEDQDAEDVSEGPHDPEDEEDDSTDPELDLLTQSEVLWLVTPRPVEITGSVITFQKLFPLLYKTIEILHSFACVVG